MTKIRMIASDMDGTFLNERGQYNCEKFIEILNRLDQEGIKFVVSTGNQMTRLNTMFEGLTDRLIFVAQNGAQIVVNDKTVKKSVLSKKEVSDVLNFFKGHHKDYGLVASSEKHAYLVEEMKIPDELDFITLEDLKDLKKSHIILDSFDELPDVDIYKLGLFTTPHLARQLTQEFNDTFDHMRAVSSGFGGVDIIKTGIHKAWGIKEVMALFDISPSELMAFGDSDNDIEMLELANASYAMENADEVVKENAKYIAPSNREEGVLQVIENYLDSL